VWPGRLGVAAVRVDQRPRGPRLMAAPRGDESTISVKRAGRKPAASRSRLMIEDHLMTPPVSQIASGAPDPIKLGARKMGGNLGSVSTRETAHYAISHGAGVRFRTNCAIPEGPIFAITFRPAPLESRSGSRLGCRGMPLAGNDVNSAARQRTAARSGCSRGCTSTGARGTSPPRFDRALRSSLLRRNRVSPRHSDSPSYTSPRYKRHSDAPIPG
jgi:hypothetical protein